MLENWKTDYNYRTFLGSSFGYLFSSAFALYNGYVGLVYGSVWHGSLYHI